MLPAFRPRSKPARSQPAHARRTGVGVLVVVVTAALAGVGTGPAGAADRGEGRRHQTPPRIGGLPGDLSQRLARNEAIPQTSDGKPGLLAPQAYAAAKRTITNTVTEQYSIAPGLSFARFDRNDSVRGNIRGQLLTLDQAALGMTIDYANPRKVPKTETMATLVAKEGAIAGINGDFFDIGDTGASLGFGMDRQEGLLKGPVSGWNTGFWIDATGVSHVGDLPVTTTIKQHKNWKVAALNPPSVPDGSIGAYDERWGAIKGYNVTDEVKKRVRMVEIRGGRVVSNRTTIPKYTKIKGKVLIGRGAGAKKLAGLRVGYRSGFRSTLAGSPPVAITGNKALLINKIPQVIDDREMHPRTAIGIDRDTNRILMLVVDGRQSFSRGLTMVELAQLMAELGADDALNLDGGGSSTMMAPDATGAMSVRNSPSDGHLRKVANGLVIDYTATPGAVATTPPPVFPPPPTPTPTPAPVTSPAPAS